MPNALAPGTKAKIKHKFALKSGEGHIIVEEYWYEDGRSRFFCCHCDILWEAGWSNSCPHIGWVEMNDYIYEGNERVFAEEEDGAPSDR